MKAITTDRNIFQGIKEELSSIDRKTKAVYIISFLVALLFLYAAISKLIVFDVYLRDLGRSPFLEKHVSWLSVVIPVSEIMVAIMLFNQKARLLGLLLAFAIMLMFTCYVGLILDTQEHLPCSCGGLIKQLTWRQHLKLNISYTVLLGVAILLEKKR